MPEEITPATKPAEKFAPSITAALLCSPTNNPNKCLLVGSRTAQHIAEKGTSRASCAPMPVHRRWYPRAVLSKVHGLIITNKSIKLQLLVFCTKIYENNVAAMVNYCADIMQMV
jgi:hypothetical protein